MNALPTIEILPLPSLPSETHAPMPTSTPSLVGAVLIVAVASSPAQAPPPSVPMPGEFLVIDGRVDAGTYAGWRLFQANCQTCHGVGGVGTAKAPNLVERIKTYTPRGFAGKVVTSYRIEGLMPDGGPGEGDAERQARFEVEMRRERTLRGQPLMPAWAKNDEVPPHVLDLYAYLSARAEAGLGPGKPVLIRP
jgi:cytochrome c5